MAAGTFTRTLLDRSAERSTVQINIPVLTGANISDFDWSVNTTLLGALAAALDAITMCNPVRGQVALAPVEDDYVKPANAFAQREIKLLVEYQDEVTKKRYHLAIPGPDWENIEGSDGNYINPLAAKWVAFKAAMEAFALSPDGNAVTVITGRLVGRNL